jgi:hypothetical protein
MNRIKLIQEIIRREKFNKYLEIGTNKGGSLLPMRCRNKFAVDPSFKIPVHFLIKWYLLNGTNFRNRYFKEKSDDFFTKRVSLLDELKYIDVFLVDGLHTFEQSLKDVLNSLKYLNPSGLIVMHDCYPPDRIAATPAQSIENAKEIIKEGWKNAWCGDVWKTIVYLHEVYPDSLDVCVINTDFGLGIVRLKSPVMIEFKIDQAVYQRISSLDYSVISENPAILNLKDESFANELINDVAVSSA